MEKPDVDQIDGLSPAISIDQKGASRNPRSTVGTVTEIYDYLRLLFARAGHPALPERPPDRAPERPADRRPGPRAAGGDAAARPRAADQGPQDRGRPRLRRGPAAGLRPCPGRRGDVRPVRGADARQVQAPQHRGRRRPLHRPPRRRAGGRRADAGRPPDRSGDRRRDAGSGRRAARRFDRDRAAARRGRRPDRAGAARGRGARPSRSAATASGSPARTTASRWTSWSRGTSRSTRRTAHARPAPGLGTRLEIDPDLVIPDKTKSLQQGALVPWAKMPNDASWRLKILEAICQSHGWYFKKPVKDLPPEAIEYILRAEKDEKVLVRYRHERGENTYKATFEGIVTNLERRYRETDSEYIKTELEKYMVTRPCPTCHGKRLKPEVLAVTVDDRSDLGRRDPVDHGRDGLGRPAAEGADGARADDRLPGPQGDHRAARVPRRRRARLPDDRPGVDHPVGRRGPADPPRDPDRDDADGRPLHPRRAVDRAPPAGQREADRDADPAPRPRQHRARRRARRGDDPDGRLGRRHRAGGRRARRRDHRQRPARGRPGRAALDHRGVPPGRAGRAGAEAKRRKGNLKKLVVKGAREHNLRKRRLHGAARDVHRGHRRVRERQVDARDRRPVPGPRPRAERLAGAGRRVRQPRAASSTSTRSSRSTRARSAGRRARTRRRTPASSARSASSSPASPRPASAAISRAASASTSRAGAARTARATGS